MTGNAQKGAWTTLILAGGIGLLFAAVGVLLVVNGDAVLRLAGVGTAALGIIAITLAVTYGLGPLVSRPGARRTLPQRSADDAIVFPRTGDAITNVVVAILAGVFLTTMVAVGVLVGAFAMVAIAGVMWLLIVPATIQSAARTLRDPTAIELSANGLRTPELGRIPWSDIERLAIEDQRPLVARPGVNVIGSTRVLAIHLRPGAEPPRQGSIDRAMRWVQQGYVAMGARAGYGEFHWLAVPERVVGVPLEEVLDAASAYVPTDVSPGVDAVSIPAPISATPVTSRPGSIEAPAAVAVDADLGREADAIHALLRGDDPAVDGAAPRPSMRPWAAAVGFGVIGLIVGGWLGTALTGQMLAGPNGGVPWPFIVFAILVSILRAGGVASRRRGSTRAVAFVRPMRWALGGVVIGFILGAMLPGLWSGLSPGG